MDYEKEGKTTIYDYLDSKEIYYSTFKTKSTLTMILNRNQIVINIKKPMDDSYYLQVYTNGLL